MRGAVAEMSAAPRKLLPRSMLREDAMIDNAAVLSPLPADVDAPLFAVLDRFEECEGILARNNVGRVAFALQDRVSVLPVHYVSDDGWIYGRTSAGGKLREILRNRRIAFEVDEHTQLFEWRSVVVRGPLYLIDPGTLPADRHVYSKAVSLIRRLVPATLTDSDPVPFRDQLFRIRVVEISGRSSEPGGGRKLALRAEIPVRDTGEADADLVLRQYVERGLAKLTLSPRSQVRVDAFDGVVALTGAVETAAERSAVEAAVLAVPAVQAVVQQLETVFPIQQQPTPAEIARNAVEELHQSPRIEDPGIKVVVEHGWFRLEGTARSARIREDAIRRLRGVKGSRGVIDRLRVKGQ
jgi:nitroimidazol reductase NimA-like FMN-containing flavoprotein (pyridoxamine 5'-phosphate oxidase superfamily)/osmotically-inducible protein OsmY